MSNRTSEQPHYEVWDPNRMNPYGYELAHAIARLFGGCLHWGCIGESDRSLRCVRILRKRVSENGRISTICNRISDGLKVGFRRPFSGRVILVAWVGDTWQILMLITASLLGARLILVDHNPEPGERRTSSANRWAFQCLKMRSVRRIVHSEDFLRSQVKDRYVPHPLYVGWKRVWDLAIGDGEREPVVEMCGRKAALFIGRGDRPDKGASELPRLAQHLDTEGLGLIVASSGLPEEVAACLDRSPNVMRIKDADPIDDAVMHRVLYAADVLVAPYRNVTASGTVMLACTYGIPVVCYRSARLADVVPACRQVDPGDTRLLALAAKTAADEERVWARSEFEGYICKFERALRSALPGEGS